ncbi:MAG TPA: DNA-directed RNA polymerase subunit A' [Candidatus Nanoarchaeia archaeon]|nr:DNA-directed RNA polymerase subunit A' [Candidatus Nanoarchaeia archaeon]
MTTYFRKQVRALKFKLLSPDQIKKLSCAKIVTPELYDIDGFPVDGGLMDLRLGAIDPGVRCRTCGKRVKECPGHAGSIELARPVVHIKYIPLVELCLRSFCPHCGKLTLNEEKQKQYAPSERAKKARDAKKCPFCAEVIERVKLEKPSTFMIGKKRLSPIEVRERLLLISDDELKKIGVNAKTARPEWAILSLTLVPSVTVRPSITLDSGERSEDDLTHKLSDIIRANQRLWENLNAGAPEVIIEDLWDLLQYHVTTFFDNNISRIPPARHRSGQPLKTITERIKGKEGRIRHNLAGKRVNYSGRTVVSPDPYIGINEVGIPVEIAKIITVAESVTILNLESLKEVIRKAEVYPGANYVIRPDGKRKRITEDLKEEICNEIQPGYKVERHLRDGDVVLFNRHPSLHKQSLMAHYVRVLPGRTFRLNPATAVPYNADFDGDEMNVHSPQTEEARAEAQILLDVKNNIISSKNNMNLVGTIADAVTGNYILSTKEIPKSEADQLLYSVKIINALKKKVLTGSEIFEQILPKGAAFKVPKEITGDNSFGSETGEMVKMVDEQFGRDETLGAINRAFVLGTIFLSRIGYTLSLQDLNVSDKVKEITADIVSVAEKKTKEIIASFEAGELELLPGKTADETREIRILQVLNEVRTDIGRVVKANFPVDGNVNKMITPGAAGSMLNITQIACCVGQQALGNKRISFGYTDRTLPFFKKKDLSPESRGFIKSSFFRGLKPTEFFFGAITGRDSLMDLALRTPKSGYLYRRLVSALQDLKVEYDGTVRDASERVVQYLFGDDGKDVSKLHLKDNKVSAGEAIGVITAQSFGEAATQMVLNVFHHAGVAEMQVTQGLPRIIEILDARKQPSTPRMELWLDKEHNNDKDAKVVAEKIKEVMLREIASEIKIDFGAKKIEILLDSKGLRTTHIGGQRVADRLVEKGFDVKGNDTKLTVHAAELDFKGLYKLKEKLKKTIISGVKGITQVVVSNRGKDYVIVTAGSNLSDVIKVKGIDAEKAVSNDIHDVCKVFGVEAARQTIVNEIKKVIETQGLDINIRHLKLVADAMTTAGAVKGITRMGIISDKASVLARATFETPDKQFVNATVQGARDELNSVVENILLNQPIPVGTGLPGLLVEVTGPLAREQKTEKKKK